MTITYNIKYNNKAYESSISYKIAETDITDTDQTQQPQ